MTEYPFVNIRIELQSEDTTESSLVYQQRFLSAWLMEKNPKWLSEIIALTNNLEINDGK